MSYAQGSQGHLQKSEENLFKGLIERNLPPSLQWRSQPFKWSFDREGKLIIVAGTSEREPYLCLTVQAAKTNFYNPIGPYPSVDNACFLATRRAGDFTMTTRVFSSLANLGDAACVIVWASKTIWAKLCVERISSGEYAVVTVVTNSFSDGAHGEPLVTSDCHLKLSRKGNEFAMHYSKNGEQWKLARYFCLDRCPPEMYIGVCAQSPLTKGCTVEFLYLHVAKDAPKSFPGAT